MTKDLKITSKNTNVVEKPHSKSAPQKDALEEAYRQINQKCFKNSFKALISHYAPNTHASN